MSDIKKILLSTSAISAILLIAACTTVGSGMSSAEMAAASGQTTGTDMQGNVVELDGFTYGGDNMATYNSGLLGTGVKDPAVCGGFSAAKCSVSYTE